MDGSTTNASAAASVRKSAPYLFLGQTTSLCEDCLALVPAKIIAEDANVFLLKRCREHGVQKTLIADDLSYWKSQQDWLKPGDRPLNVQTRTDHGCPYDCGLCPDHEQHSCLAIIEINEACNLSCPVCFAESSVKREAHRPLAEIERMLDIAGRVRRRARSGADLRRRADLAPAVLRDPRRGAPAADPPCDDQHQRPAHRPRTRLRRAPGGLHAARFEVYLQFDSLKREPLMALRGADLTRVRQEALEALERNNISTTLVVTLKKGVNDAEIPTSCATP
jgi:uncharacterized radical SAM superfamily Fe-S cluster-containing enzyme